MECQPPGLLGQAHSSSQKCLALCTYLWGLGLLQSLQALLCANPGSTHRQSHNRCQHNLDECRGPHHPKGTAPCPGTVRFLGHALHQEEALGGCSCSLVPGPKALSLLLPPALLIPVCTSQKLSGAPREEERVLLHFSAEH